MATYKVAGQVEKRTGISFFEASGDDFVLKVAASDGVLTGINSSVPNNFWKKMLTLFGMTPATVTKTIIGRSVDFVDGNNGISSFY